MQTTKLAITLLFKIRFWRTICCAVFSCRFLLHLAEDSVLISQHQSNAEQIMFLCCYVEETPSFESVQIFILLENYAGESTL